MSPAAIVDAPRAGARGAPRHAASVRAAAPIVLLAVTGTLLGVRRAEAPYADTDVLWGARSGSDILSGAGLPHTDAYSWTAHGAPWIPNSWAWNVVLGTAYRMAGYAGIALVGIVTLTAIGALLGVAVRRVGASPPWGSLTTQISLGAFALFLYPRAQLVDYAAVVGLPLLITIVLDGERRASRHAAIGIVAGQIVWMNLHSTAVLGPLIVLAVGAGRMLARRSRQAAVRTAVLMAATAMACLATPYGFAPIGHLQQVRAASVGLISEWRPAGLGSPEQILALVSLALAVMAAADCYRRRAYDTLALLVLFGAITAVALRFAPMLVLTAVPPLAAAAGRIPARRSFVNRICALALVVLAAASVFGAAYFADPGAQNTSPTLVEALPRGCRLVNDMTVGGAVILERPDVQVSIDSRNDMYGRQRELTALRVLEDASFGSRYVDAHDVGCVLAPSSAPLVRALTVSRAWRTVGHDATRTLLVRPGTA